MRSWSEADLAKMAKQSRRTLSESQLRLSGKAPAHVEPNYVPAKDPVIYDDTAGKGMRFECHLLLRNGGGKVAAANRVLRVRRIAGWGTRA